MAKAKKIQQYVPLTKYPRNRQAHKFLSSYTPEKIVECLREKNKLSGVTYYHNTISRWESGQYTVDNFMQMVGESTVSRLLNYIFSVTPEFQKINSDFLVEFDSREDLQGIYQEAMAGKYHVYPLDGKYLALENDSPYRTRPDSFMMFEEAIKWSTETMKKIELSRETPYQEGDLVLLREPMVDHPDWDPLYIGRWSQAARDGAETPDKTVKRIGTVISVTDSVMGWRATKGSKTIKVLWMGIEDARPIDVQEKIIKWYMRPTKANGMKT